MSELLKIGDRVVLESDLVDLQAGIQGTVVPVKESPVFLKPNENPHVLGVQFDNKMYPSVGRRNGPNEEDYVLVITKCKKVC